MKRDWPAHRQGKVRFNPEICKPVQLANRNSVLTLGRKGSPERSGHGGQPGLGTVVPLVGQDLVWIYPPSHLPDLASTFKTVLTTNTYRTTHRDSRLVPRASRELWCGNRESRGSEDWGHRL